MKLPKAFSSWRQIRPRKGFTLIELLVFVVLFLFFGTMFVVILVAVTRVQVRQSAAAEVNQQSQFLTQTIQNYVQSARLVDMTADTALGTLKLRESNSANDPTYIYLGGGGALGSWQTATPLPNPSEADSAFVSNGNIYLSESYLATYYAKPNSDGSVSNWSSTTALSSLQISGFTTPVNNGYVYMVGGDAPIVGATSTVMYAPINSDGSMGVSQKTTKLPTKLEYQASAAYNGYIYTMGGQTAGGSDNFATSSVFYAKPNSTGSISSWSSTTALPDARTNLAGDTYNGYLYAWGGDDVLYGNLTDVYYAKPNSDGSVSNWLSTTPMPSGLDYHAGAAYNGYLYTVGGSPDVSSNPTSTVFYAPINTDGSIGSWVVATQLPSALRNLSTLGYNGYLYTLGGLDINTNPTSTVLYAPLQPSTTVYLQQTDSGTPQPLTSNKVSVSNLSFTRHYQIASSTAIGQESVSYAFTMAASSSVAGQTYSQSTQSSAAVLAPVPKIALIQKAMGENNNTGISGVSSTYPGANTAGNLLLAVVSNQGGAPTTTVADTQGNVWTQIASAGPSSPIFVQATSTEYNGSLYSAITSTFPSATINGDLIIATVGCSCSSPPSLTLTDTASNTYALATGPWTNATSGDSQWIYYAKNIKGGSSNKVTATFGSSQAWPELLISEYSGADPTSPLDVVATSTGNSGTANSGSATTNYVNELIYGSTNSGGSGAPTAGSGFTLRTNPFVLQGGGTTPEGSEDKSSTSTGSYSATFTIQSSQWMAGMATFKGAGTLSAGNRISVFAAPNAKAGANTVTATFNSGTANNASMFLYEYRGANTTLSVDASSSQAQTSTTPSSGFVNPQANVELLLGVSAYNSLVDTWTPGAGYTMESSSTVSATLAEDKVVYVTSPVDASWSINNARTTLDLVVALH
jgi:type II secretory pathway pseudopilin PulG